MVWFGVEVLLIGGAGVAGGGATGGATGVGATGAGADPGFIPPGVYPVPGDEPMLAGFRIWKVGL